MKYTAAAFLTVATMLCALTIAIAREGDHLGKYEWAVPYLIVTIVVCVALGVISLMVTGRQGKSESSTPSPAVNVHFENIGNPVHDQSNRQTVAASLPVKEAKPHPELELFDCKSTVILYGGTVWYEADLHELNLRDHPANACIAIFRKKPVPTGQEGVPAYDVTAHLTYRNAEGEQQIINYGTWLGEYAHRVDFTRGESHSLVLSSTTRAGKEDDGKMYVFDNPCEVNPFKGRRFRSGITLYEPDEKLMLQNCNEVEIALISKNITVYEGKLRCAAEPSPSGLVRFSSDN